LDWLHPADAAERRWGWWRLYDSYGCAIRSYAFAVKAGKARREQLNRMLLEECEAEIEADGQDQLNRARRSAYGTSFPEETKRAGSAGWYFSSDAAFDLAVACQLDYPVLNDPRPAMRAALISNLNYEQGCNPVNITYLAGMGWKRQCEMVDQYAQNSRRALPPTGLPLGNIQAGIGWLDLYQREPGELSFPSDGDPQAPYPFYDRWSDSFNLSQEFVIVNQARALAYTAWLMAQTPLKNQPWKSAAAGIAGLPGTARVRTAYMVKICAPGLDLASARVVWETGGKEPVFGQSFAFTPTIGGAQRIEVEAQWPDGRRVFAMTNLTVK